MKITRNIQKVISIIVILVFALSSISVFAQQDPVAVSLSSTKAYNTGTATIELTLDQQIPVSAMNFKIKYDSNKFQVNDVKFNTLLLGWSTGANLKTTGEVYLILMPSGSEVIKAEPPIKIADIKLTLKNCTSGEIIPVELGTGAEECAIFKKIDSTTKEMVPLTLNNGNIEVVEKPKSNGSSVTTGGGSVSTPAPSQTTKPTASPVPSNSPTPSEVPNPSESPIVTNQPQGHGFKDFKGFEWAEKPVAELKNAGIVSGKTDTEFKPEDNVTRAEFAKLIVKGFDLKNDGEEVTFNDVTSSEWYSEFISIAASNGIVTGYEGNVYNPDKEITREELCVIAVRALKKAGVELPAGNLTFKDANEIEDFAKESVAILAELGIVGGKDDGRFAPKDNATRAESAKIVYGILKLIGKLK